jgi:hypothetical protein
VILSALSFPALATIITAMVLRYVKFDPLGRAEVIDFCTCNTCPSPLMRRSMNFRIINRILASIGPTFFNMFQAMHDLIRECFFRMGSFLCRASCLFFLGMHSIVGNIFGMYLLGMRIVESLISQAHHSKSIQAKILQPKQYLISMLRIAINITLLETLSALRCLAIFRMFVMTKCIKALNFVAFRTGFFLQAIPRNLLTEGMMGPGSLVG